MFTIAKYIPGLALLRDYKREWFRSDLVAGLSLATVALPVGIAYAQLAGFPAVAGIVSCIMPAVAYAFFGSSRQLVVNPDSAVCMIIISIITPLTAGDPSRYIQVSTMLTILVGVICIIGGILKLGVIANFLSKPILSGYLNGIALSIIVSQLGPLLGFKISSGGFFRTVWEGFSRLGETHITTLILGVSLFILMQLMKKFTPRLPAAFFVTVMAILAVHLLGLTQHGVATVGTIQPGFPAVDIPTINKSEWGPLLSSAAGIVLVSYCSMMPTAKAFASRGGYRIRPNQDMFALGVSQLASAFSGGFAVSGADSRTVVAVESGGKTQVATIVAAIVIAMLLLFLTAPLALVPKAAMAAILVASAIGLFDVRSLSTYYSWSRTEFFYSLVTTLGVMTVGVLPGVLVAVGLALLRLLRQASHPHDAVLGKMDGHEKIYTNIADGKSSRIPGIVIYRFDSSLLFFNAGYFKDRVRLAISNAESKPGYFILDAEAMPMIDVTGCDAINEIHRELANEGIVMMLARSKGTFREMLARSGIADVLGKERLFYSIHDAVQASALQLSNSKNQKNVK